MCAEGETQRPMDRLIEIMRILRSEKGCPWDREQTLRSLKPYLVEECYEALEALDEGDAAHHAEELGDVLLQIVFQSQIRAEEGVFTFDDVVCGLCDKLVRRHPHVFGDVAVSGSKEVLRNWESIKKNERASVEQSSALDGIPRALPALIKAQQLQRKAARVGFDWAEVDGVLAKIEEELREVRAVLRAGSPEDALKDEVGDLLFAVVNLSRFLGYDAEDVLNGTIRKFIRRFRAMERQLHRDGKKLSDCSAEQLDALWNAAKQDE